MIEAILRRTRLVATLVALLTFVGLASWLTMPRQEDPSFAERFATLIVPFPGSSALDVERLVLAPIEERLEEVTELREVRATARPGIGVFQLRLVDATAPDATDAAWDEVRRAVDLATPDLPAEALEPRLDTSVGDPATAVVLVTGSGDALRLRAAAKQLEDRLQRVPGVERVTLLGDPGRRIEVAMAPEMADRLGLSAPDLAQQLRARNVTVPGGSVVVDGRSLVLRHLGELDDVAHIRALPVVLPSGATVPLSSVADVNEATEVPRTARILHDGAPAVGVSVVPVPEQDLVGLGERLEAAIAESSAALAPLRVEVFAFQPTLVRDRIGGLTTSLLLGVLVVAGVLFVAMGPRMGVVVSAIVPLVAIGTIAIYALGGGVLHQISIAALVLALGLLVDNAIVVAESVQQHLDAGHPDPGSAAVRELALPLGTATGTTVAAFVPMLLASGGTADFTRTIPLVVILALVLSYVYALVVTPSLATRMLRPSTGGAGWLERVGGRLASLTVRRPRPLLALVAAGVLAAGALTALVPAEFFPMSDRDRVVVSVALPEGTHATETEARAAQMLAAFRADPAVSTGTAFVGGGLPRFYYNLNDNPGSPHRAEIVLTAPDADLDGLVERIRTASRRWPDATVVPKRLQQGPPVGAPVQIRLHGTDPGALRDAVEAVTATLRGVPGARDVRHDLGTGLPTLELAIDDAWTGRLGVGRGAVPMATLAQTHGLDAGVIRNGSDPIGIRVTTPAGERTAPDRLGTVPVTTPAGPVPLMQVADVVPRWAPAAVHHRDGVREVVVSAELAPGATFGSVLAGFERADLDLPAGVTLSYGGEAEGSGEANTALLQTLPLGLGLLVFFLLLEFDSFRRLGIILTTVPLAATGVVPGLALTGQPFGFMSMLGVIALVGIVVNNAIVLLNVVEQRRSEGASVPDAVSDAIQLRLRPILLTTLTTVAGMVPLAVSDSALWPPLAWAMISGLLASTALTLVAVPALYTVLFGDRPAAPRRRWLPLALLFPAAASAAPMNLDAVIDAAETAPLVMAAESDADAASRGATAAWLDATTPRLVAQASDRWLEDDVALDTPLGPFVQTPKQLATLGASVQQPLFDPSGWAAATARSHGARAERLQAARTREELVGAAVDGFLDLVVIDARVAALGTQRDALSRTVGQAEDLMSAGLALESDAMRARVALAEVEQGIALLGAQREALAWGLAARLGLDEPVQPVFDATQGFATSSRPDLQALDSAARAVQAERIAIATSMLPRVTADLGWQGTDNATLVKSSWSQVGVTATWALGAGRLADVDAASARLSAVRSRSEALQRGAVAERAASTALLEARSAEIAVREASLAQADAAAGILADRYAEQLATLTDVLDAEATRASQRAALEAARVEVVRARLALALAG
ncbi:MAG: efflux RND transporter permease subunit [Alphaproteobacteria bacterium]|nr:efflux RND transporter permease subunit [Alphaproteobacteria bacterium]